MTICVECKHHRTAHDGQRGGPPPSTWFYQVCTHPSVERGTHTDPVTGLTEYNYGGRWPHCRDINHGDCKAMGAKMTDSRKIEILEAMTRELSYIVIHHLTTHHDFKLQNDAPLVALLEELNKDRADAER